jgi:hypothetical protein
MMNPDFDPDLVIDLDSVGDSTIVRRGSSARTFSDMADFAAMIQHRPLERLFADFRDLTELSDTKFSLVRSVLRRRLRALPQNERESLRLATRAAYAGDDDILERLGGIFAVD